MTFRFTGIALLIVLPFIMLGQQHQLVYKQYTAGSQSGDTSLIQLTVSGTQTALKSLNGKPENPIPGLADEVFYVDYKSKRQLKQLNYPNESFYSEQSLDSLDFEFTDSDQKLLGYSCDKASISINSNKIEIWYTTDLGLQAAPASWLGDFPGLVLKIVRNGNYTIEASEMLTVEAAEQLIPQNSGNALSARELSQLQKEKLVFRIPVFTKQQLFWGDTSKVKPNFPADTSLHTAGGTLIFKRINLPDFPDHYQVFAELTTYSNGDAYDRTGSIFVIPQSEISFVEALIFGPEKLPAFEGKDGEIYQGFMLTENYKPPVELLRFFTPFGVQHFNDRVQLAGLSWENEAYYKQEISDLSSELKGEIIIGVFIGNYDGGGHKINLDLSFYPGSTSWENLEETQKWTLPLFNTTNILEMAGQNYGKLFGTDSLKLVFEVPEGVSNLRLRYISTGHGGWGGGDEFNPKENQLFIDGKLRFVHTPWRGDCATYRKLNPVSGNFWNGMSSSDLSRSGWCPGEATEPVYFNLPDLKSGKHSISVAIPQGQSEGNSFSFWSVSGALIGEKQNNP